MKAVLVQPDYSLKMEDYPTPEPGPGEVVVKVAYCGICGTDLHLLETGLLPPGCIIGHEMSGHIAAVGKDVEGWGDGDAVVVMPMAPCFTCNACRKVDVTLCTEAAVRGYGLGVNPGGFSEYILVKPTCLFRIPEGMDMKLAALNEPWAVAVRGVNKSNIKMGSHALVMGAGPIGLLCAYALKNVGATGIYVSAPDQFRAEKASAVGVDLVIAPIKDYPGDLVHELTGSYPEFVFACGGAATTIQDASNIVASHGQIIVMGVHPENIQIFPLGWFIKEIKLCFSLGYSMTEFAGCLQLLARGAVDLDVVVSAVMPLSEMAEAFEALHKPGHTKILIDCQAT